MTRIDPSMHTSLHANECDGKPHGTGLFLSGGGNGVGTFDVDRQEFDADDPVDFEYAARLDVVEEHGPGRVTLGLDGLEFHP